MPRSLQPHYVSNARWDSPEKVESRSITIINLFRDTFGVSSIPEEKQYWTMCGAHFDKHGALKGEFGHLLKSGFIQPSQFHGVDREEVIIQRNQQIYPDAEWHHGDFLSTMEDYENFNPAVINYDGVMQPKFGSRYLKSIMKFVDFNVEGELLLVANFLLINPYTHNPDLVFSIDDTIGMLFGDYYFPDHWRMVPQAYSYGTGRGHNLMGVLMFVKKSHDPDNISITENRRI